MTNPVTTREEQIYADRRAGMSIAGLMKKYKLGEKGLKRILQKVYRRGIRPRASILDMSGLHMDYVRDKLREINRSS